MPFKDKKKRYEAICKSRAKKPEYYNMLARNNHRKAHLRGYQIKRLYGITRDDYDAMKLAQGGVCAICGLPQVIAKKSAVPLELHVDHDHKTGKVRGLLCMRCNTGLAHVEKEGWLERVKEYLEKNT